MEKRKIQKIGYSTLCVSLPKDWIVQRGVNRGDFVYLSHNNDGALRVLTEKMVKEQVKPLNFILNLELIQAPKLLERLIVGCYMMNAETIVIASSNRIESSTIEEVRMIVNRTIGLSIIEETKTKIVLTCSIDPTKFTIHSLIKRQSSITLTMFNEGMEAFSSLDVEMADDVIKRENEANGIYWLITRLLFASQASFKIAEQMSVLQRTDIPQNWSVSRGLERISDCAVQISNMVIDFHKKRFEMDEEQKEKILDYAKQINIVYTKAVNSIFSNNVIEANEAINLRYDLDAKTADLLWELINPYRIIASIFDIILHNIHTIAVTTIHRGTTSFLDHQISNS